MEHTTEPVLTRYEEATVIGLRATRLAAGDPPRIPLNRAKYYSVNDVARLEYEAGVLDYMIDRRLPNGQTDTWRVTEMRPAK